MILKLNFKNPALMACHLAALLMLGSFIPELSCGGAAYYVATNGNDSWSGTAPAFEGETSGPWRTFEHINSSGRPGLQPGDVLYVRGGIYNHTSDTVATSLRLISLYGSPSSPIVISNYPGETPVIFGSGRNNSTILLRHVAWLKIIGINSTNAYRQVCMEYATNCEFARSEIGGGYTNYGFLPLLSMYHSSQSNWVHHCVIHDALASPQADSTHGMTFGLFYSSNDFTSFNIIESNTCYHAGHDAFSCYGPSNLVRGNFAHNEPWTYRSDLGQLSGHRDMEIGGTIGNHNWVLDNRLIHAGHTWNGGVGLEVSDGIGNLIRGNLMAYNDYAALVIYGGKVGLGGFSSAWGLNHVVQNTFLHNGFAPRYCINMAGKRNDLNNYKHAVMLHRTVDNSFINNLFCMNYSNAPRKLENAVNVSVWSHNIECRDSSLADPSDGGAFSAASPSADLAPGSRAIDAGTWLTQITSESGEGNTLTVADAGCFFPGMTAAGHTVPGDTVQLQGQTERTAITAISGNTITVARHLAWTHGQGLALAYAGAAPDAGASEFGLNATTAISR